MITVIGGIKGGSGKTTLATNLTVIRSQKDRKVLLVDADEQKSASDWAEHRDNLGIKTSWTTIQLSGPSVRSQILKMKPDYDDIIVDTGGRDTTSQRAALTVANILIAPFQPRSLDVWTIGKLSSLLDELSAINPKLKCIAVINRADTQGKDNDEAREIIGDSQNIACLPSFIGQRKAFANAAAEGLGVIELKPKMWDQKAFNEIKLLEDTIFNNTKMILN